ncbi:ABC transporter permease [Candidatus Methylocalor cossyra]|uniref:ABC3 transporter permease C-terminal domain-containing protein n=1 Tax=Candidatus Methylocalor cossyra TaxID=3108543 RepID=A0ABM9NIL4_9GAMM
MRPLHLKLLRELWQTRGQVLAIAAVIAGGVATLIMALTSFDALTLTRDAYYREAHFAEVFASLKRAPEALRQAIESIPGVQQVETRVVGSANLAVPGFADPATAILVSLPDGRNAELNRLYLRAGRLPAAGRAGEAVLGEAFAEAHHLHPGDHLTAIIHGRRQDLEIVGIALSPEYIYQIRPGDLFPDFERYGVLWMNRSQLAQAFDLGGAFNDVVLTLTRDARPAEVIDRLDALLARYGGSRAITREDQISHRYLQVELTQLGTMARVFPTIFLGVAAFLLNVVVTRLVGMQRDQIAILKAFGYRDWQVGVHYGQWVSLIVALGLVLGLLAGLWLGDLMTAIYRDFFRFPYLTYRLQPRTFAIGVLVTAAAGLIGTFTALRRAVRLPPAEAMRPEPPPVFRPTVLERLGLERLFTQPTRIILRNLERQPVKALLSVVGIAMAVGILMVGRFQEGAVDFLIKVGFELAQRDDLTVTFVEPTSYRAVHAIAALPGVDRVEPFRSAPVVLRRGTASYRTALQGLAADGTLRRVLDDRLRRVELPAEGLLLNDFLATTLRARPGDRISVEFLEGRRQRREVPVAGIVREFTGATAYLRLDTLNRLLLEGEAITGVLLAVEPGYRQSLIAAFKDVPRVVGVTDRLKAIQSFYDSLANIVLTQAFIATLLAGSIAFGVVYNSARVAFAERSRELASLRILGFTRAEIAYILLGELALITLAALPLGFLVGLGLTRYLVQSVQSDLYRIPLVVEPKVFAFAASVVLVSALLSGAIVARQLYRLDLIAVLKTRE